MIKIAKIRDVKDPTSGSPMSAGIDLYIPNDFESQILYPNRSIKIPSGLKMIIPENQCGIIMNKSSIGSQGILVGAELIDSDYRGEIHIDLHNVGIAPFQLTAGQKITQIVIQSYSNDFTIVNSSDIINNTTRGIGGFGSTGDK